MGAIRAWSPHVRWTDAEVSILRGHYATASVASLEKILPGRSIRHIQCKANDLGLARKKEPKRTPDQTREAKRKHMADRRKRDIQAARDYANVYRMKNSARINAKTRAATATRIFWARALRLRNGISAKMLARLWKEQRGLCALSGEKMGRDAEIDHKMPRARGGTDYIGNLQWVTPIANMAKRDLTDAEFAELCRTCARWIGERIEAVEAITAQQREAA